MKDSTRQLFLTIMIVIESKKNLKLNVIARLDFDLAYFEAAVQHFSYYITPDRIRLME